MKLDDKQKAMLGSKTWRLQHLYRILTDEGEDREFHPNVAQRRFYNAMWYRNVILKSRKLGFTTMGVIDMLDDCLWIPNTEAGLVTDTLAHSRDIFRRVIRHAYDKLDPRIRKAKPLTSDSKMALEFENGSVLSCGVSLRSATPQRLHISEFGRLSVQFPEKAREIVTGTLESVASGGRQIITIESTAAGKEGYYYEYVKRARETAETAEELTELDYKLHFFAWWQHPGCVLEPKGVPIPSQYEEYFAKVESEMGVTLRPEQKAWYVKKAEQLGPDMKREYPSTPDEPFEAAHEGTYFERELAKARTEGRICRVPVAPDVLVDTHWDLGWNDTTAIVFSQTVGRELHVVDYYENSGEALAHYADLLRGKAYRYGRHNAPHDVMKHELGSGLTLQERGHDLGLDFTSVERIPDKRLAIEAARSVFAVCWFDQERCDSLLEHLSRYRKEWNEARGCYRDRPLHDEHSNGADAFETMAQAQQWRGTAKAKGQARPLARANWGAWR